MAGLLKQIIKLPSSSRCLSTSSCLQKARAGRYRPTKNQSKALTYEMAQKPDRIGVTKSWNSWNTAALEKEGKDGWRGDIALSDIYIRNFIRGTWHSLVLSEIIIKRQHNMVRIAFLCHARMAPIPMYFLLGYSEEFLSHYLQGPVKLELQIVHDKSDIDYKFI